MGARLAQSQPRRTACRPARKRVLPASALAAMTSGPDNGICPVGCAQTAGYDTITGLGSPRAGIDAARASQ